jgi:hypothetical protein
MATKIVKEVVRETVQVQQDGKPLIITLVPARGPAGEKIRVKVKGQHSCEEMHVMDVYNFIKYKSRKTLETM